MKVRVVLLVVIILLSGCSSRIYGISDHDSGLQYIGKIKGNPGAKAAGIRIETPYKTTQCTGIVTPSHISTYPAYTDVVASGTLVCRDGRLLAVKIMPMNEKEGLGFGVFSDDTSMFFGYGYDSFGQFAQAATKYANDYKAASKDSSKKGAPKESAKAPTQKSIRGTGTGFYVSDTGLLITNYHVIEGGGAIAVYDSARRNGYPASKVASDPQNDLAVLQVQINASKGLPLGKSSGVRKGEQVMALGYPVPTIQGAEQKATFGRINSLTGTQNDVRMFQIDVPLQPGNSGGPLLNNKGEVVGVATAITNQVAMFERTGNLAQNVNYAVKADYVQALLSSLGKHYTPPARKRAGQSMSMEALVDQAEDSVVIVFVWDE